MNRFPIHPLLFSLFPIISLYEANKEFLRLGQILTPIIIVVFFTFFFQIIFSLFFKSFHRGALLTSLLSFIFFSFRHLAIYLYRYLAEGALPLVFTNYLLIFIATVAFLVISTKKVSSLSKKLNSVSLFILLIPLFLIFAFEINRSFLSDAQNAEKTVENISEEWTVAGPDIYYIILDGYAREDVLQNTFSFNNSYFLNGLRERGFKISDSAISNYSETIYSMSSSLNMEYHDDTFLRDNLKNKELFLGMVANSKVDNYLGKKGYKSISFAPMWVGNNSRKTDIVMKNKKKVNDFLSLVMMNSPIPFFDLSFATTLLHKQSREKFDDIIDHLGEVPNIKGSTFSYAHILSPHFQHFADKDGNLRKNIYVNNSGKKLLYRSDYVDLRRSNVGTYKSVYLDQLQFVNKRVLEVIDEILTKDDGSVIVIQSDHGPLSGFYPESVDRSDLKERFSILTAIRPPSEQQIDFPQDISPVNIFRTLFNNIFSENFDILENRSYFIEHENKIGTKAKRVVDVTESLSAVDY